MTTQAVNPGGSQNLWDSFVSLAERKANKVRARFWEKFGSAADKVDKNIATPALEARNRVVGGVQAVAEGAKSVVTSWNFKLILIILVLLLGGWVLMQTRKIVGK